MIALDDKAKRLKDKTLALSDAVPTLRGFRTGRVEQHRG